MTAFNLTSYKCMRRLLFKHRKDGYRNCRDPPTHGSSIVFEFSFNKLKKKYYVRTLYNGENVKICPAGKVTRRKKSRYGFAALKNKLKKKKNKGKFSRIREVYCEYGKWKKVMYNHYIQRRFYKLCGNNFNLEHIQKRYTGKVKKAYFKVKIIALLFTCLVGVLVFIWCCRKSSEEEEVEKALKSQLYVGKFKFGGK